MLKISFGLLIHFLLCAYSFSFLFCFLIFLCSNFGQLDDTVQVNDLNCIDEQSLSPEYSGVYDVFGEPDIFPRVGEQYQVEIPS